MDREMINKAGEIIQQNLACNVSDGSLPYCVLALIDENGYPTASTVTAAKADGINWVTFSAWLNSDKVKRINHCNHVRPAQSALLRFRGNPWYCEKSERSIL